MLKNVSDGQLAVASPSVPLDRNIPRKIYTGIGVYLSSFFDYYRHL